MSSELAISVRNVSKVYRIYDKPEHRLIQMATIGRVRPFREFAALHDISFDMYRGETIGIVGRNGCGKSTLLQIICGTLQPTAGHVEVNGRIAALLELGAGFNGEFTGRENAYMNGALLGFSRDQMNEKFEEISRFAAIGDFIERPVKTYSSGMFVRLAFAVATAVEPDILIVDEALAVGDEAFQRKCFVRIEAIKERGGTILFVSHGAQTIIQLCDRAVLLDAGEKLLEDDPKRVIGQYQRLVNLSGDEAAKIREEIRAMNNAARAKSTEKSTSSTTESETPEAESGAFFDAGIVPSTMIEYEHHGAVISNIRIEDKHGRVVNVLKTGGNYSVCYDVRFETSAERIIFGFQIKTISGLALTGANNEFETESRVSRVEQGDCFQVAFEFQCRCLPSTFSIDVGVHGTKDGESRFLHRLLDASMFRVASEEKSIDIGIISMDARLSVRKQSLHGTLSPMTGASSIG